MRKWFLWALVCSRAAWAWDFYDRKELRGGWQFPIGGGLEMEASGGYGFDRRLFEATSFLNSDSLPVTSLDAGWFAALRVRYQIPGPR